MGLYIDNIIIIQTIQDSSATTPDAPIISSIDNGNGQVVVNFIAGNDGGATITDYEYSIDDGLNFTSMATTTSPYHKYRVNQWCELQYSNTGRKFRRSWGFVSIGNRKSF